MPPPQPDSPQAYAAGQINPSALSIEQLARLLSHVGGRAVTSQQVQADLDAGAPAGADGRINLLHYVAWLAREVQSSGG